VRNKDGDAAFWTQVWFECEPCITQGINELAADGWQLTETSIGYKNLVWHEEHEGALGNILRLLLMISIVGFLLILPFTPETEYVYVDAARLHFRRATAHQA